MNIVYEHHEGSQAERPLEVDTISSSTVVYLRKNIEQITREDEMSGEEVTLWSYDEAELTPEEYDDYSLRLEVEQQRADIDFIAMMTDVELTEV